MSSSDISDTMEVGDWQIVNVLIATAYLTKEELEKEHGVFGNSNCCNEKDIKPSCF